MIEVPLCSESQVATLESWGFIPVPRKYKNELLGVASTVYRIVWSEKKTPPAAADCVDHLTSALETSPGFGSLFRSNPDLRTEHRKQFARGMAQHLLDNYWFKIQRI
jgi:hypothetical protein